MSWADLLRIGIPVLVAILVWLLNEHSKRQWEWYKRKEDRYVALVESLRGFYANADPTVAKENKDEFINQVSLCWLYCPDEVIRKAYNFLDHVRIGVQKSDKEKEQALGAFILEVREDLLKGRPWWWKRTKLKPEDFRNLSST